MKKLKTLQILLIVMAVVLGFSACGKSKTPITPTGSTLDTAKFDITNFAAGGDPRLKLSVLDGIYKIDYEEVYRNEYIAIEASVNINIAETNQFTIEYNNLDETSKYVSIEFADSKGNMGYGGGDIAAGKTTDSVNLSVCHQYGSGTPLIDVKKIKIFVDSGYKAVNDDNAYSGSLKIESIKLSYKEPIAANNLYETSGGYSLEKLVNGAFDIDYENVSKASYAKVYSDVTKHTKDKNIFKVNITNKDDKLKYILFKFIGSDEKELYFGLNLQANANDYEFRCDLYGNGSTLTEAITKIEIFIDSSGMEGMTDTSSGSLTLYPYEFSTSAPSLNPGNSLSFSSEAYTITKNIDASITVVYENIEKASFANINSTVVGHSKDLNHLKFTSVNTVGNRKHVLIKITDSEGNQGYGSFVLEQGETKVYDFSVIGYGCTEAILIIEIFIDSAEDSEITSPSSGTITFSGFEFYAA